MPRILRLLLSTCLGCCALALAVPRLAAQRPRDAEAAMAAFAKVADRSEAERRRAVPALGDFADDAVTELLLRELHGASEPGFRQELVRALGRHERKGATAGLLEAFAIDTNPRLLDAIAAALAAQGEPGVTALVTVLDAPPPKGPGVERSRRTAALTALGGCPLPAARARLCSECRTAAGRDRLPALRALAAVTDDPDVAALRRELAGDRDVAVAACAVLQLGATADPAAAAAALALHRRGKDFDTEAHTAILTGLLTAPVPAQFAVLLAHAAAADDPLGEPRRAAWQRLAAEAAFAQFLGTTGVASKQPAERETTAALLGLLAPEHAAVALAGLDALLARDEPMVQAAAIAALLQRDPAAARERFERQLARGGDAVAAMALDALAQLQAAPPAPALLDHAKGPRVLLRAAALHQLAAQPAPPDGSLAAALAGLAHARWPVRAAAIALARTLRAAEVVPALIERLGDDELRLRADARAALRAITLRSFPDQKAWAAWWQKDGATFVVPPAPAERARPAGDGGAATTATYWDIPVTSDRIAFVVDTSGSMNQPFGTGGQTRLEAAQRQFERALEQLPPRARCNLIAFAAEAKGFADRLQPADAKRRAGLVAMAKAMAARGPTNVHAALQLAFADPDVDTIFVLTDGHPSSGAIVDPDALAAAVRRWNQGRGIAIHTIALGGKSAFLEQLARDSGGEHTVAR